MAADSARASIRARSDPAGKPRSAARQRRLSRAREFSAGAQTTVAERIAELKLHEIVLTGGAVLETNCVYIVPLLESLALPADMAGGRQSEKLDRPHRCFHPRHRRPHAGLRSHRCRISRPALCRDQPEDLSGAGARRLAAVADPLPPRPCAARCETLACACTTKSGSPTTPTPISTDGIAVGVDLAGLGPENFVGYRAKRHTGLIDVESATAHAVADFWEPIAARADRA